MEELRKFCSRYGTTYNHYLVSIELTLEGRMEYFLENLHAAYHIVTLVANGRFNNLAVIIKPGNTTIYVRYQGFHKVFSSQFNGVRYLHLYHNSHLDFSCDEIKYLYGQAPKRHLKIKKVHFAEYPTRNMDSGLIDYIPKEGENVRSYYRKQYRDPINTNLEDPRIILSTFYYDGNTPKYPQNIKCYSCYSTDIAKVLAFNPKRIIVESGCGEDLEPLYTCKVKNVQIKIIISRDVAIRLLENTNITHLCITSLDEQIIDIMPYKHLVYFRCINDKPYRDTYSDQLLQLWDIHMNKQVKSARNV